MNNWWFNIKDILLVVVAIAGVLKFLMDWILRAASADLDAEVKRLELFTRYIATANAWGESRPVEKVVESIMSKELLEWAHKQSLMPEGWKDGAPEPPAAVYARRYLSRHIGLCMVQAPVGATQQQGAIGAVYTLGARHPSLRYAAIRGLRSLQQLREWESSIKPLVCELEARERSGWYDTWARVKRWIPFSKSSLTKGIC